MRERKFRGALDEEAALKAYDENSTSSNKENGMHEQVKGKILDIKPAIFKGRGNRKPKETRRVSKKKSKKARTRKAKIY